MNTPKLMGCSSFFTKFRVVGAISIMHNDTFITQSIGNQKCSIWQKCYILRLRKVSFIPARYIFFTQCLKQVFSIVRENIDNMTRFINNPYAFFRIVGAYSNAVRSRAISTREQVIPLVPYLNDFTFTINHINTVLPYASTSLKDVPFWYSK